MRGVIEGIDSYFTRVRLDDGALKLFNHKSPNHVEGILEGTRVQVDVCREEGPLFASEVVTLACAEVKVPVRRVAVEPAPAPAATQALKVPVRKRS